MPPFREKIAELFFPTNMAESLVIYGDKSYNINHINHYGLLYIYYINHIYKP